MWPNVREYAVCSLWWNLSTSKIKNREILFAKFIIWTCIIFAWLLFLARFVKLNWGGGGGGVWGGGGGGGGDLWRGYFPPWKKCECFLKWPDLCTQFGVYFHMINYVDLPFQLMGFISKGSANNTKYLFQSSGKCFYYPNCTWQWWFCKYQYFGLLIKWPY